MTENYWALKLNLITIIKLWLRAWFINIKRLIYIEITKPGKFFLTLVEKTGINIGLIIQIKDRKSVAGPILNLSSVRDNQDRVISLDIYKDIMDVRREILKKIMDSFRDFTVFKKKPESMFAAILGLRIGEEIKDSIYLANYAKWKYFKKEDGNEKDILILSRSPWVEFLNSYLSERVDRIKVGKGTNKIREFLVLFRNLLVSILNIGPIKSMNSMFKRRVQWDLNEKIRDFKKCKIMITYGLGFDKDKRNDLAFFHASNIDPSRLFVFFQFEGFKPSPREIHWMKENGINFFADTKVLGSIPELPKWRPPESFKRELKLFYKLYLDTFMECLRTPKKKSIWLLGQLWRTGIKKVFWINFFKTNNIGILINHTSNDLSFIQNQAISETGGMAVQYEWSIRFDYCTYLQNAPSHIGFVTGGYSHTQIPEASYCLNTIQTGGLHIGNRQPIKEIKALRDNSRQVIAVFDEIPNDVFFGESIKQLYEMLLELVFRDQRFSLLIKTKKPQVLAKLDFIYQKINELCKTDRCLIVDWKMTAAQAAANADLVVSVPSTAAFESVLTGTRTIIFNPMKTGCSLFYADNGLNKRIFEEKDQMIIALMDYAEGNLKELGDCSNLISRIDPFNDEKGAERMGNYLEWCLEEFDDGYIREKVISRVNARYVEIWGVENIKSDSFEKLNDKIHGGVME